MWFFRRKQPKPHRIIRRVVVGLIIGGAIGSIVGKKLMDEHRKEEDEGKEERED